jgi:hypothetical protein
MQNGSIKLYVAHSAARPLAASAGLMRLSYEYADCDHPNDNKTKTSDQHRDQSVSGIERWSIVTDMELIVSVSCVHHTSPM